MAAPRHMATARMIGVSLLCAALGGLIVRKAAADQWIAAGHYETALAIGGSTRIAATRLAIAANVAGDNDLARSAALKAIDAAPMNAAAVRTLGLVEQAGGRLADAGRWMNFSAALGWRDAATRIWLARTFIAAGRPQDAIVHLDAMLRQDFLTAPVSALLDQLANDDATRARIVESLRVNPPWRAAYLTDVDRLGVSDIPARQALLDDLRRVGSSPDRPLLKRWVDRLIALGRHDIAYATWRDFAADRKAITPGGVYDGTFETIADGVEFPFEWRRADGDDTGGRQEQTAGQPPRLVLPSGLARDTVLLRQTLMLSSGRYVLTMKANFRNTAAGAPIWALECPAPATWLPFTSAPSGAADRGVFTVDVPAGCRFPILTLRAGDDGVMDGTERWISNVALHPGAR